MKTVLLHAATFARLSGRLKPFERQLDVIVQEADGAFRRVSTGETVEKPEPDAVFANQDAFYTRHVGAFLSAVLTSPRLDWFQSAAAGIDHPVLVSAGKAARRYTTNHRQAEAMAEWALWQALDFLRAGPAHRAEQAQANWKRLDARELMASRWLIIGYGAIGEAVGRRVSALGGHVTGVRRSGGSATGAAALITPDTLHAALPEADIVLLCVPHTAETENMANQDFFAAMRADALFMNLGRGALVDETALVAALGAGRPAFAALDVTREEPLPASSPLWRHPQIAITPHDSSQTQGTALRADETFMDNLARYLADTPLQHLVSKSVFET